MGRWLGLGLRLSGYFHCVGSGPWEEVVRPAGLLLAWKVCPHPLDILWDTKELSSPPSLTCPGRTLSPCHRA